VKLFFIKTKVLERRDALRVVPRVAQKYSSNIPKDGMNRGHVLILPASLTVKLLAAGLFPNQECTLRWLILDDDGGVRILKLS
jgi:hypothetical protein